MGTSTEHEAFIGALESDLVQQRNEIVEAMSVGWMEMSAKVARGAFESHPAESDLITDDQLRALKKALAAMNGDTESRIRNELYGLLAEPETGHSNTAQYATEQELRVGEFLSASLEEFRAIMLGAKLSANVPHPTGLQVSYPTTKPAVLGDRYRKAMRQYLQTLVKLDDQKARLATALKDEDGARAVSRWDSIE